MKPMEVLFKLINAHATIDHCVKTESEAQDRVDECVDELSRLNLDFDHNYVEMPMPGGVSFLHIFKRADGSVDVGQLKVIKAADLEWEAPAKAEDSIEVEIASERRATFGSVWAPTSPEHVHFDSDS